METPIDNEADGLPSSSAICGQCQLLVTGVKGFVRSMPVGRFVVGASLSDLNEACVEVVCVKGMARFWTFEFINQR
ncbi:hypothetical protein TNCT_734971 [Trichonephila clavata]|uniref:Uncharacterized protein n=1 Tax=Trichonephila clavata TaxID=2740835 RepID=A0A8X6G6D8_TRICU|nr:hypothetical protein TNCT_734971 [Trichonephila clavata]